MSKKLTVSQKMSEKFSKLVRSIYCDYRNSHGNYTHRSQVYVIGNSKWNQDGVVFGPMRMRKHSIFILTEVDEGSNFIATYIVPLWHIQKVVKWFQVQYNKNDSINEDTIVQDNKIWLCKVKYEDVIPFEDKILLNLVNQERENI